MQSAVGRWLEVMDRYYLCDFIGAGGSAFKLLLTQDDGQTQEALSGLRDLADQHGYWFFRVSASETRVDLIEQIFFQITRQIEWHSLVSQDAANFLQRLDYVLPDGTRLSDIEAIADASGCDEHELKKRIREKTIEEIVQDREMCKEFRTALARSREAQFFPGGVTPSEADTLLAWLQGRQVNSAALRRLSIYSPIGRHNARDMLTALARWLAKHHGKSMVLGMDLSALLAVRPRRRSTGPAYGPGEVATTTPAETTDAAPLSLDYTRAQFLDACEVLRQFIDDTDELTHCLICCVAPSELETGKKRKLQDEYPALHNRLVNEVRDREKTNVLAAMVRAGDVAPQAEVESDGR